jgi:hypothetical protein
MFVFLEVAVICQETFKDFVHMETGVFWNWRLECFGTGDWSVLELETGVFWNWRLECFGTGDWSVL